MPITRAELRQQHTQGHEMAIKTFVDREFTYMCSEIASANLYGSTTFIRDMTYQQHWSSDLVNQLVAKLQAHYIDSSVIAHETTIHLDWTFQGDEAATAAKNPLTNAVTEVASASVQTSVNNSDNSDDGDIHINISLPSRIRTRSSTRK